MGDTDVTYTQIGKGITDAAIRSRTFEAKQPQDYDAPAGRIFWIARWPGDQIEGRLVAGPIVNPRRNSSYILQLDPDHPLVKGRGSAEIEIWGNKLLHKILRENDVRGRRLRIEYVGGRHIPGYTRAQKVYRVYLVEEIDGETRIQ